MSISPPSDIVLDVAQAADPQRLQAAAAKLARMATGAGGADFSAALGAASDPVKSAGRSGAVPGASGLFNGMSNARLPGLSPYQKFEAMVLQNFVQNVLPKDENLFGDAASADICRSMLAEQVAAQMAKTGKLGIAKLIEAAHGEKARAAAAAMPPVTFAGAVPAANPATASVPAAAEPGAVAASAGVAGNAL